MRFFKNIALMLLVNVAIVLTISIILNVLGIQPYLANGGLDIGSLAIFCLLFGMVGSFFSLLISKFIAKSIYGIQIIDPSVANPTLQRVYEMVRRAAMKADLKMPEVGIYDSPELNAFATGPSRNNALVAVSTGLLSSMRENEVEGVIGHEVTHIANGDMVTMTLLQGIVNALIMFVARIVGFIAGNAVEERNRHTVRFLVTIVAEMVFGLFGVMVTSWFSRRREFRADAGGAALAGRDKMIAALEALRDRQRQFDPRGPELQTLKIFGKSGSFLALMSSHPPLDTRIDALRRAGS
jgi:heat shock protein HtpX